MRDLDDLFAALSRSRFRSRIRLADEDAAYLERTGLPVMLEHAANFVEERLAPASPRNDGRQTPWHGHPVFVAQHATATCCRSCLAKWHGIEKLRPLSDEQVHYVVRVIRRWLEGASLKHNAGTDCVSDSKARIIISAAEIARRLKNEIKSETGLVASVGVAPNKFLAKIASDLQKPDGLVIVDASRVQEFLDPLKIGRMWGVGRVTGGVFDRLGARTIGDLRRLDRDTLSREFVQQGDHFWRLARGLDDRPVVPDREAKSISHETTFATDIADVEALRAWLLELTEHVGRRLRQQNRRGRTIHLKVRFADFRTITRSKTLPQPTDVTHDIWQAGSELLAQAIPSRHSGIRLLGVGISGFVDAGVVQRMLFDNEDHENQRQLDTVADAVRDKFGSAALSRGSGLLHHARHRPDPRPGEPDKPSS